MIIFFYSFCFLLLSFHSAVSRLLFIVNCQYYINKNGSTFTWIAIHESFVHTDARLAQEIAVKHPFVTSLLSMSGILLRIFVPDVSRYNWRLRMHYRVQQSVDVPTILKTDTTQQVVL